MTPILLLFFGLAPSTAIATDLWFAATTKLVGAIIHHDAGQVDWQVARRLWSGSLPIAILTAVFGGTLANSDWLTKAIGCVVTVTALGIFCAPRLYAFARRRRLNNPTKFKSAQPILTRLAGALLGLCVALTSIGAGALGSVMLVYLYPLRMTPHRLVATDLTHAIPLAMVAGLGYLFAGCVDLQLLISMLAGSIPAIILGSLLAKRAPGRLIQILLAIVLFIIGLNTIAI